MEHNLMTQEMLSVVLHRVLVLAGLDAVDYTPLATLSRTPTTLG